MSDVTRILCAIEQGEMHAADDLLPLVYKELRALAALRLAKEKPGQTLQATALVHEAYVRLVDSKQARNWNSRGHFFGAAAEAMRRILVDNARRKLRPKHGGGERRVEIDDALVGDEADLERMLAIDEAIRQLENESPQHAALVKLRYFAGMTLPEVAESLGISRATASRIWAYARAFLFSRLEDPH